MIRNNNPIAKILVYSGVLPFFLLGIAGIHPVNGFNFNLSLAVYGAVIISFLSGIHWAIFLFFEEQYSRNLFIHSNVVTLLAWLSVLSSRIYLTLLLQIICFSYLLILDYDLYKNKILPAWFYRLRCNATGLVTIFLFLTLLISCFRS